MSVTDRQAKQDEADKNFEAFQRMLPKLTQRHEGKYVLLRQQEIVDFFDTARDALLYGKRLFEDGLYSVQKVGEEVKDLGFYSHAVSHG